MNSIGNRETKELICMTHGHEVSGVLLDGREFQAERGKGGKLGQL